MSVKQAEAWLFEAYLCWSEELLFCMTVHMQEQLLRFWCRGGELRQSLLSAENPLAPNFSVFHSFSFLLNLKMKLAFHSLNFSKSIQKHIVKLREIEFLFLSFFNLLRPWDEVFDWQQDNDDTAMTKEYPLTLNMLFLSFLPIINNALLLQQNGFPVREMTFMWGKKMQRFNFEMTKRAFSLHSRVKKAQNYEFVLLNGLWFYFLKGR